MSHDPQIQFEDVSLAFAGGAVRVLDRISLAVNAGEVLCVLGPSGCGKTSLLRLIAGLLPAETGRVHVNGAPPVVGKDSAIVFQNFRLLPWKTLAENIAFVLPDLAPAARAARVQAVLELVGLARFANSFPRQVSGGMQQRVALARALAVEPQILLMDEPFASLDAQSRELMQAETLRLARGTQAGGQRRTVVFVTHSVDEALILGDRVLLMSPRPGRVHQIKTLPFSGDAASRRAHPEFAQIREGLWQDLRDMVLSDPQSDFFGRGGAVAPSLPR